MQVKDKAHLQEARKLLEPDTQPVASGTSWSFADLTKLSYNRDLEFIPWVSHQEDPMQEPDRQRVRRVTVVHHDGRAKHRTIGVTVDKNATLRQVAEAAAAHPEAACGPDECTVLGSIVDTRNYERGVQRQTLKQTARRRRHRVCV